MRRSLEEQRTPEGRRQRPRTGWGETEENTAIGAVKRSPRESNSRRYKARFGRMPNRIHRNEQDKIPGDTGGNAGGKEGSRDRFSGEDR